MKQVLGIALAAALALLPGCGGGGAAFDPGREIHVFTREGGSGTRDAFTDLFGILEKGAGGTRTDHTSPDAAVVNKTGVMLVGIAADVHSIGYLSIGSLGESVRALDIDGAAATAASIVAGEYPFARPFLIATRGAPEGLAADFISFILSAEGQAVVTAAGYIAVEPDAAPYGGSAPAGRLVVGGSSSVTPVMERLCEAYRAVNPHGEVEVQMSDSSAGLAALRDGGCDIGMASRDLKEAELEFATPLAIALDGIAVIVARENPVSGLTAAQVRGIFTGDLTEWREVTP